MKFVDPSGHDPCDSDKGCEDSVISTVVTIEHVIRACGGMINCDKMIAWLKSHPGYNPFSDPYYTGNSGLFVEVWGQMASIAWSSGDYDLAAQYHSTYLQGAAASDPNMLVEGLGAGAIYVATNGISAAAKSSGLVDGGCSFNAQTLVTTTEGEKAIVLIREGDKVLAWNQETGTIGYYTVTDTHAHLDHTLVYLTIDGETILTTPEHPFFTENGEWVGAGDLRVGSRVKQIDGDWGMVQKVEVVEQLQMMYNLTVAQAHTFVVGDGQWLVHNQCSIEDILSGANPGRQTTDRTKQYTRTGGMNAANEDFDSLNLDKITEIPGVGRYGVDANGRTVIVRSRSTYGAPTIEVQLPNSKNKIEIRYE